MPELSEAAVINRHLQQVPVDLDAIASELGLVVERIHMSKDIAGKLVPDTSASGGYRIVINSSDPPGRQRFTFAHEIAHFMLHRDLVRDGVVDNAFYRSTALGDHMERQADRFAAQLLLPAQEVRRAYSRDRALARLAKTFQVSDSALRIRLKELGLMP